MSLRSERTKWVMFLPCSNTTAEHRHVLDLAYGVLCLERSGILPEDIFIYIDSPAQCWDSFFNFASRHQYVSRSTSHFFTDLIDNTYDNLVMFVTGHGGPFGLDAPTPISPNQLISSLKAAPNLKQAVIYLGQCFAGTFNYVNAGRARGEALDIIIVGATNLHQSLSASTREQFLDPQVQIPWIANVFLLHVFKWMSSPRDVDGDGLCTIMDSYKYAGVFSNDANKQAKTNSFVRLMDTLQEFVDARDILRAAAAQSSLPVEASVEAGSEASEGADDSAGSETSEGADESAGSEASEGDVESAESEPQNLDAEVDCKAKFDMYMGQVALHHVHQECWILNSRPAQTIEF